MFKNVASQKLIVYAFDSTTNLPKTGDSANLTAYVSKDYGSVTVLTDTSATEMDSTNGKGYYLFDLTQSETNGDCLLFSAKSSTANIVVIAVPAVVFTLPSTGILAPTTSGRTLDVSAGGEAGIDWANIGSPTTTVGLSGTTVKTATDVETDTADIQSRLPAALVSGRIDASVGAMAANTLTASALATDAVGEIADGVWDEALSGHLTVGTTGRAVWVSGAVLDETTSTGTPTTTTMQLTAGSGTDDYYNDLEIIPLSGAVAGQARVITDYTGATKTVTIDEPWTSAPASGVAVLIRATHKNSINQIQAAVWNADMATYVGAGTFGEAGNSYWASTYSDIQTVLANLATTDGKVDTIDNIVTGIDSVTDKLDTTMELDGMVYRFTTNALETAINSEIESGYSLAESTRLQNAVLLGKVSGGGTTTEIFRDIADTKNRVTATVDASGNRTAITLDET